MFGVMYVLDSKYPAKLGLTFSFIQKILMKLEDGKGLKPRLYTLSNNLLVKEMQMASDCLNR